ncbi:TPA: sigma-54 interaction domain-containing protein [Clostridioides difficile]
MNQEIFFKVMNEILENIDEGVHFVNKEGKTIIYNNSVQKMEKMNRHDILTNSFFDIVSKMKINRSTLVEVLEKREIIKDNIQKYLDKNGKEITAINTTIPIDIKGEFVGALEISKNMTTIENLLNRNYKKNLINKVNNKQKKGYEFDDILGESNLIKEAIAKSKKACKSDASVFIYGETGTGKELFSQSIHYGSNRRNYPFIAQNCAALPESLFEGILFGTSKGGFTGAIDRPGLFEQANKGTLLLDEINSMPIMLQAKLLRVLQEGYVRRVGGTKDIPIDVRIIATTNESPRVILNEHKMRKDLYYRLNIIHIKIPPLRDRKEDIPLLCKKFISKYNKKLNKKVVGISDEAIRILKNYNWQGNIRELENIIYCTMSMMEDEVQIETSMINLNDYYNLKENKESNNYSLNDLEEKTLNKIISEIEEKYIYESLEKTSYNITKAASILGMNRQNLQYKIKKYNIKIL